MPPLYLSTNYSFEGFGKKRDTQFAQLGEFAIKYGKPVRIGANWGSLDQALAAKLMDENHALANPLDAAEVLREALIRSALLGAGGADAPGAGRGPPIPAGHPVSTRRLWPSGVT